MQDLGVAKLSLTSELTMKKPAGSSRSPTALFIVIKQEDYTGLADEDYQDRMGPPAPYYCIN